MTNHAFQIRGRDGGGNNFEQKGTVEGNQNIDDAMAAARKLLFHQLMDGRVGGYGGPYRITHISITEVV